MRETQWTSAYGRYTLIRIYYQRPLSEVTRKVEHGYNFDHCRAHPVARRRRRLLRVPPVRRIWARRRFGFGPDHSYCALVFRRSELQPPLIVGAVGRELEQAAEIGRIRQTL